MSDSLSKPGMSKLYDMEQELKKLQDELMNLGSSVADSQIWHKKARIEELKKKIAELNSPAEKFKAGTNKLKDMMAEKSDAQLSPEQLMQLMQQKQAS